MGGCWYVVSVCVLCMSVCTCTHCIALRMHERLKDDSTLHLLVCYNCMCVIILDKDGLEMMNVSLCKW